MRAVRVAVRVVAGGLTRGGEVERARSGNARRELRRGRREVDGPASERHDHLERVQEQLERRAGRGGRRRRCGVAVSTWARASGGAGGGRGHAAANHTAHTFAPSLPPLKTLSHCRAVRFGSNVCSIGTHPAHPMTARPRLHPECTLTPKRTERERLQEVPLPRPRVRDHQGHSLRASARAYGMYDSEYPAPTR